MTALSTALEHYRRRARTARAVERRAATLWKQVDRANIVSSWASLMPQLLVVLTAAQRAEAAEADAYVAVAMAEQGLTATAAGQLSADAWAGIASDGRTLDSLLMQPVVTVKTALNAGRGLDAAMTYGRATLQMIATTQVADAGRTADQVAMVSRGAQGYVRMVVGKTCSRCTVLAGRWYRWNAGFNRHPHCDCISIPAAENAAGDLHTDPRRYFAALDTAEQDRIFGKAGAQAIRDGADMAQVVNARSGMYEAAGARLTRTGMSRRATYGGFEITPDGRLIKRRRGVKAPPRLMPEEIYRQAAGSRERAIALLRRYGYLTPGP